MLRDGFSARQEIAKTVLSVTQYILSSTLPGKRSKPLNLFQTSSINYTNIPMGAQ
jgi:hypothetical protein